MAKLAKKQQIDKCWRDVRAVLATQGSAQLLEVARDLYQLSQENRDFLNARCLATANRLEPYKKAINEAIYPNIYQNKPIRISAARKAISQYTKATGDKEGTLELMVYFVECGTKCTVDFGRRLGLPRLPPRCSRIDVPAHCRHEAREVTKS
jgi:hypothetical protein